MTAIIIIIIIIYISNFILYDITLNDEVYHDQINTAKRIGR